MDPCASHRLSHADFLPAAFHDSRSEENLCRTRRSPILHHTSVDLQVRQLQKLVFQVVNRRAEDFQHEYRGSGGERILEELRSRRSAILSKGAPFHPPESENSIEMVSESLVMTIVQRL